MSKVCECRICKLTGYLRETYGEDDSFINLYATIIMEGEYDTIRAREGRSFMTELEAALKYEELFEVDFIAKTYREYRGGRDA